MLQFIKKAGTMQTIKQQIIRWPFFFFRKMITLYSLFGFLYQRKTGMGFGWKSKCAIHDIAFNALLRVFFSLLSYRSAFSLSCCCVADFIRVETHPTTCFLYTKLTCFGFSLGFVGRKRHIIKSPSLNIERNDVTDSISHSQGASDQQIIASIEQQIFNNESKITFFLNSKQNVCSN